ncbi:MAG: hypothetical protein KA715_10415 [Xanthomonadaceae bacterium]|nr:hypothetical protein [Xanthomonadaceae bacterium]
MKRKLIIVFPDDWLPFSPITLNLYDQLSKDWNVEILTFRNKRDPWGLDQSRQLRLVKTWNLVERVLDFVDKGFKFVLGRTLQLRRRFRAIQIISVASRMKAHIWVTVDTHAAWALQKIGRSVHLVSLELYDRDPFVSKLKAEKLRSVLIQSKTRLVSLSPHVIDPVFVVQNAPVFPGPQTGNKWNERSGLVMSGSCIPEFGLNIVLKWFRQNTTEKLAFHGTVPSSDELLIRSEFSNELTRGNLSLSLDYMGSKQLLEYLHQFRVGFCFYDLRFEDMNQFNFWMAPSGKLFHYFAAGVPVIATDLPGLQVVREYNTGVLIRDDDPRTIRAAIEHIQANYDEMVQNCYRAAAEFSFDRALEPFREYLLTGEKPSQN